MVNAVFPHNETDARAMQTALNLLRNMADRGNTYLGSRHSLLLGLRAAIGPKLDTNAAEHIIPPSNKHVESSSDQAANVPAAETIPNPSMLDGNWAQDPDLPSFEDISFEFDLNDDPALWEGALDGIDIDMDTDWIESTLKR